MAASWSRGLDVEEIAHMGSAILCMIYSAADRSLYVTDGSEISVLHQSTLSKFLFVFPKLCLWSNDIVMVQETGVMWHSTMGLSSNIFGLTKGNSFIWWLCTSLTLLTTSLWLIETMGYGEPFSELRVQS
jgi:hypothetical protein